MAGNPRSRGRMLNHCITRPSNRERHRPGPFIDRYTENLRGHCAPTLRGCGANLERCRSQAVAEVGEPRVRIWRLYMAPSRIGFETDCVRIHQMLGIRLDARARSEMPLRANWEHYGQRGGRRTSGPADNGNQLQERTAAKATDKRTTRACAGG